MSSVVDKPKESNQQDLLQIDKYTQGLVKFINYSATPITIGIQGEWGSGKTSLLNTIKEELCDSTNAMHYSVWLNTWEYSLLSTSDETLIKIISGLVTQISELTKNKTTEKGKKAASTIGSLMKNFGGSIGGIAGKTVEVAGEVLESTVNKPKDNSIKALRNALQEVIDEAIKASNGEKKSFIFFIDDLDRLDPAVAVSILELIKNLFDLKNCIFVLAIDYGVVVKGLQSKFGAMTEENEWEFRAFFDKIIQLPFSMPMANYNIGNYLQSLLIEVNYFSKEDMQDSSIIQSLSDIVNFSVGTNPRALKRLANSVSLIEIIRAEEKISTKDKVIEFALICLQIAYPLIYGLVQKKPDFTTWDNQFILPTIKNKSIEESDLDLLKETEEFDEEWEQNVWRICQINSFLKQRVQSISKLFNFIKDNFSENNNEDLGEALDRLLSMSSVTSVSADSTYIAKKKHEHVSYNSWEEFVVILQKEHSMDESSIDNLKVFLDAVTTIDGLVIKFRSSKITLSLLENGDSKASVIANIYFRKKGFVLELINITEEIAKTYLDFKYNAKYQVLAITFNNKTGFEYKSSIEAIKDIYLG